MPKLSVGVPKYIIYDQLENSERIIIIAGIIRKDMSIPDAYNDFPKEFPQYPPWNFKFYHRSNHGKDFVVEILKEQAREVQVSNPCQGLTGEEVEFFKQHFSQEGKL